MKKYSMTFKQAYARAEYVPEHYNRVCQATIPAAWEIKNNRGYTVAFHEDRIEAAIIASGEEPE